MQQGLVARLGRALIITVFVFLRLFLSVEKCALSLHTSAVLLGLVCDVAAHRFIVPPQKAQSIIASIEAFIRQGGTKRELAQLAGKLASISPAVQLAPLFLRRVFQAMGMASHWEDSLQEPSVSLAVEDLLYFRQYLESNPGWRWAPRTDVTEYWCAGDASETGYGGHSHLLDQQLILPFSTQDAQRMASSTLSSTCREIKNICYLVTACIRQDPDKVANTTIVCYSDNQGAVANVNNLRGSPEEVTAIRDMWVWASQHDVQIRVEWRPRTTDIIRMADSLSRVLDQSDYALSYQHTLHLCRKWGKPTGDAFAGHWAHAHKAPKFFTASPCHVGEGHDATIRDWSVLGSLVWVFPPPWLIREAIAKILRHRCNSILIVPNMGKHQQHLIALLPVKEHLGIPPHQGMFEYGSKFPMRKDTLQFLCNLDCFYVVF
jgi:hypothetical protein